MTHFAPRGPLVLVVIATTLLASFTTRKLIRMCQIRGWLPGASVERHRVTDLWHEVRVTRRGITHGYWLSWGAGPVREPGPHRLSLPKQAWSSVRAGDPIEVIRVPFDRCPYTRDDLFVESGQFGVDGFLLSLELAGLFSAATLLWRRRLPPPPPPPPAPGAPLRPA